MEGVRSAISSRSLLSTKIKFQFARVREIGAEEKVAEEFELSIARPMGINIEGEFSVDLFLANNFLLS